MYKFVKKYKLKKYDKVISTLKEVTDFDKSNMFLLNSVDITNPNLTADKLTFSANYEDNSYLPLWFGVYTYCDESKTFDITSKSQKGYIPCIAIFNEKPKPNIIEEGIFNDYIKSFNTFNELIRPYKLMLIQDISNTKFTIYLKKLR